MILLIKNNETNLYVKEERLRYELTVTFVERQHATQYTNKAVVDFLISVLKESDNNCSSEVW